MATYDRWLVWMWLALVIAARVGTGFVVLSPPELLVVEGSTAVFTCSPLFSVALPILERNGAIYRDPLRLSHSDQSLDTPDGSRTYQLRDVRREETGAILRCYMGGFFSNPITLTVVVLPALSGRSGELTLFEGDHSPLTLHYSVTGLPPPHTLHWLLDGSLFASNTRVSVVNDSALLIQAPLRGDTGNYTLVAVSTAGHASLSLLIQVVYDEFLEFPVDVAVTTGDVVKLRCVHRFGWAYAWLSTHRPLHQGSNKVVLRDTGQSLWYGPVDYTDHELSIHCVVHVRGTERLFISPPATLTVHSSPEVLAPLPTTAKEGSDVFLQFNIYGHPFPSHAHYLHNGHTPTDERARVEGVGGLYIVNATRFDAGNYTLIVSNELGDASNTTHLDILYAPVILPIFQSIVAQVFKSVSLPCGLGYHSNPTPLITWTSVIFTISSDPRFHTEGGVLFLSRAAYSDSGEYTCTVTNSLGARSTSVTLLVLDPPSQPVGVKLVSVGPSWAVVTWDLPRTNGSCPVTGYLVKTTPSVRSVTSSVSSSACVEVECEPVEVRVDEQLINVSGLVPGVEHEVLVIALSNGSTLRSEPSDQLLFITNNSVPAVSAVTGVVSGPGECTVKWSLAYSGGSPVTHFQIQFQRANDTYWRNVTVPFLDFTDFDSNARIAQIPSGQRSWRVHGLESAVFYHFRVRGVSGEGVGSYSVTLIPVLSDEEGVPSQPEQPAMTCWTDESVCVRSELTKVPLDLLILLSAGEELSTRVLLNHTSSETLLNNVSYRGDLRVQVVAANSVGVSEPSRLSLRAREYVEEITAVSATIGLGVGIIVGVINCVTMVISIVIGGHLCWEVSRQKKSLSKRVEIANASDSSISPRMVFLGNLRHSPETPSNNELSGIQRRLDPIVAVTRLTPPTSLNSSVSMV